jgi:uncharacterized Rmd1/YagE family protein
VTTPAGELGPFKELAQRLPRTAPILARACLVGERLHLRGLYEAPLEYSPLVLPAGAHGLAMVFRYGVVVMFNLDDTEQKTLLKEIHARIEKPMRHLETEETQLFRSTPPTDGISAAGIGLDDYSVGRLQVVATVLARSVVLARYEATMASAFDVVEPLALQIQKERTRAATVKQLLSHVGGTLLVQHKMIGRVEIQDKPEILWDQPELDRLYVRLEAEYELRERSTVLERKLDLISRTVETTLTLLHNRRSLRVEWYIVGLIVFEVVLTLYEMWARA